MSDPLGQSQVIPYVKGLSAKGYEMFILSCEKKNCFKEQKDNLRKEFDAHGIRWEYCSYTKYPPLLAKWRDVWRLERKAFHLQRENKFSIIHCRSYQAGLIGLKMKKKFGVKFIFDMRGFYIEERLHLWSIRLFRNYLKRLEKSLLTNADAIISLTRAAIEEMKTWYYVTPQIAEKFYHITTCCDVHRFKKIFTHRTKQNFGRQNICIVYIGSIGPWHSFKRVREFLKFSYSYLPLSRYRILINWGEKEFWDFITEENFNDSRFSIAHVPHKDIPSSLRDADFGFFFIPPVYAEKGASPTKMGEMLACGIPIITGHSVGDVDELVINNSIGYVIKEFNEEEYRKAIDSLIKLLETDRENLMQRCFAVANDYFSLEKGIEKYNFIYKKLLGNGE